MGSSLYTLFMSGFFLLSCTSNNMEECAEPTGLASSAITASGARVSWTSEHEVISYDLELKKVSANTWISASVGLTSPSLSLSWLSSSTTYDWRVKANCKSGSSDFVSSQFTTETLSGIASKYPGDVGIQSDPNVLFVEKFEGGLTNILSRYDDILNIEGMSLDSDVPAGSSGSSSLKMTSITGGVTGGGHLYKRFTPGYDSVFIRYYVKYPLTSKGYFHHESLWFGGYYPSTIWPNPQAGTCDLGNSRLSIAYEPVWHDTDPPGLDTYIYWGDMHSFDGDAGCYGNAMITEGAASYGKPTALGSYPTVDFDQWMCVEIMLKLNNPVTEYNGELSVWVNEVEAGHWGPGFPKGHWDKDKWYNNPSDPPFKGFRWRTDPNLNINWIWLEFYHDNPNAPSSYMKFANLVMATKYIGPIKQ